MPNLSHAARTDRNRADAGLDRQADTMALLDAVDRWPTVIPADELARVRYLHALTALRPVERAWQAVLERSTAAVQAQRAA